MGDAGNGGTVHRADSGESGRPEPAQSARGDASEAGPIAQGSPSGEASQEAVAGQMVRRRNCGAPCGRGTSSGLEGRAILGAPGTPIQAYDQNAWVEAGQYAKKDPRTSIAQFRAFREANLALMKSLKPEQWKLHGLHAERGEESVERLSETMAGHDLNHLRQIQGILAASKLATRARSKR
jgi:DinB superfamily